LWTAAEPASDFEIKEIPLTTTFQKRQKEMKRMEKARAKAERRAQKKLEPNSADEEQLEVLTGPRPLDDDPLAGPLPSLHGTE
jgi:DNA uptake protein ComE-like DNA-binding protein